MTTTVTAGVQTLATCTLGAMRTALTAAGLSIDTRPAAPILAHVHIATAGGRLRVSGTNFDTTVTANVADAVVVDDVDQVFVVNHAELLGNLVAAAKGDTKRVADAQQVSLSRLEDGTIALGVAGFQLPLTAGRLDDYPNLPTMPDPARFCEVDLDLLRDLTARSAVAVGKDQLLPIFTALKVTLDQAGLHMEATDRYRITRGTIPITTGQATSTTLVPAKPFAAALSKITGSSAFIAVLDDATLVLTIGHATIWLRAQDGEFPNLDKVQAVGDKVTFQRDALVKILTKAAHLSLKGDPRAALRLEIHPDHITLYPRTRDAEAIAGVDVPAHAEISEPFSIGFNPAYLLDMLGSLPDGDQVTLVATPGGRPGAWYTEEANHFHHIIMGMRLPKP